MQRNVIRIGLLLALAMLLAACGGAPASTPTPTPPPVSTPYPQPRQGDDMPTTGGGAVGLGNTLSESIAESGDAHSWTFAGQAGQMVTITVEGEGEGDARTDPRLRLLNPSGQEIGEADDTGRPYGLARTDAVLAITLPDDGTYTVRVDMYLPGAYRITVE